MRLLQHSLLLLTGILTATSGISATVDGTEVPLHQVSAEACKDCHKAIYKQWKGSMHANSTALKDPIHGGVYRQLVGDPTKEGVTDKKGNYPICLQCHAPSAARDKVTKLDAKPVYNEGVTCVSCHAFAHFKGVAFKDGKPQVGIMAYEMSEQLQGPMGFVHEQGAAADALRKHYDDEGDINPHLGLDNRGATYMNAEDSADLDLPMQANTALQTSDACMGCHDKLKNAHGVPLCATGDEFAAGKSEDNCQSCHMPTVKGVADHSMGGGHDTGMVKRAVRLDVAAIQAGEQLKVVVNLQNKQPHNVPTGAPFRNMFVQVAAYGADGEVLWRNFEKHPMKEDPQAFLVYAITGKDGKPVPPPMATTVVKNTRLKPYEKRTLTYDVPAAGVDSVRADLYFNLLWPGQVKQMKKLPGELKAPKHVAWAEAKL